MNRFTHYASRMLSILIVAFFAVFILEGLGPDFGWRDSLMHFLVTLVALAVAVTAWKRPKIGGCLFIVFGLCWILILNLRHWDVLLIGGIPIVTGILFLIDGFMEKGREFAA